MIANFILWFLILCFLLLCIYSYRKYNYWKDRDIPYDKPYLFFGNLVFIMRRSVWDYCFELKKRHPLDYVGIFLGWKPVLMVQTPELARKILSKDFEYFQDRFLYSNATDPIGSLNLFTVKNPIWKNMRYELSPMFTSMRLKMITELMNLNAKELVMKIKRDNIDKKKTVDLKELFSMYTSDTVAYTVFGIRVSILNDQNSPLWYITSHMVKWTFWRGLEFTLIFLMPAIAAILRLKFFSAGATEYVKMLFWNVVEERKKAKNENYKDLVNHLLKLKENLKLPADAGSELADNIMLAQAAVFILGSIETSSTTLSYCLHELAYHPEEQEKLYNEISKAVNENGKDILDYNNLVELKYLTACLHETMRKHTPVPYLDRLCQKEYTLNEHVTIERGVPVFINVLAIHYNEKYFPDPEQWRPERFTSYSEGDNLNFTFLPFGEGPRFCIGKRYGMMQMRAALAQLILHYKIEPGVPYPVASDPYAVLLAPKSDLSVKFIAR
ncbi:cytochrome P450 6k1-like [Maniola jurtina]|uniref:cytochrome P450 6k1-like n=1 Tax=Maniola jurtina TaxID=191418 RepID=UPI001E68A305|nr:cytochrome P450 6k1-like [Maniola jurtina]